MSRLLRIPAPVFAQVWLCSSLAFGSTPGNDVLAQFSFAGNGDDRLGRSPPMDLRNVTFPDNALFLNGLFENFDPNGYRAIARIAGFSYTTFTVAVDFYPLSFQPAGSTQRRNILTGGTGYRWLGFHHDNGHLALTLNNGQYTHVFGGTLLATQRWHRLVCAVDLNTHQIRTFLDGVKLEEITLAPDFRFNVQGTAAEESDKVFSFSNYSNGAVFYGYADNLTVWSRALSKAEPGALCFGEPLGWLAHFTFTGNGNDGFGLSPPMELQNTTFPDNTLFLNGLYSLEPGGCRAIARITGFSYAAFTLVLDFYPLSFQPAGATRRDNIVTGGTSYRWLSFYHDGGHLALWLNNGATTHVFAETTLATRRWHRLVCAVDLNNHLIRTFLDGVKLEEIPLAPNFRFNVQGTSAEQSDKVFSFANYSNGHVFYGYADNLAVIGQALRDPDIAGCLSFPKPFRCHITDIDAFLEQCPTMDPALEEILADFTIKKDGVEVTGFSCVEPISALPIAQYTDELILLQALRTIYYLDKDRSGHLPWTPLSLYDWLKSKVGGFNISSTATFNSCCGVWPDGTRYITLTTGNEANREFDRTWLGLAGNIGLIMHEARHVDGFPHSGCCPLGGSACDQSYDEANLSPYGIQYWLEKSWLDGTLHTGFTCLSPARVTEIKNWLRSAANARLNRFCVNPPPQLEDANNPLPPCNHCCAPHQPVPGISIRPLADGRSEIVFQGGLESADRVDGPYVPVSGAVSPMAFPPAARQRFYRTAASCQENPCLVTLPPPQVVFAGTEEYDANGQQWTRYILRVSNGLDYPDALFAASPQLPPCGLNPTAARTWVAILAEDGQVLKQFCTVSSSAGLQNIWFALPRGQAPPRVRLELNDRLCGRTVVSDPVAVPDPCDAPLTQPQLEFAGTEDYVVSGQPYRRYLLRVINGDAYPDVLFAPSPQLPPCGLNTNAARTWVDILYEDGRSFQFFCGLASSAGLSNLWFGLPRASAPLPNVSIRLNDRLCERTIRSNTVDTDGALVAPTLLSPADGTVYSHYPRETTLTWAAVPGAARYGVEVQYCSSTIPCSDLNGPWVWDRNVTGTSYTFNFVGAQPGRWRVWAIDDDDSEGPRSGWRGFSYTR